MANNIQTRKMYCMQKHNGLMQIQIQSNTDYIVSLFTLALSFFTKALVVESQIPEWQFTEPRAAVA